jgi:hypothetical protein
VSVQSIYKLFRRCHTPTILTGNLNGGLDALPGEAALFTHAVRTFKD